MEYKLDGNHIHTLAPSTEACTSLTMNDFIRAKEMLSNQEQKGNNPMFIDEMVRTAPTKKQLSQANAQSVIQVITDSKPDVATNQREYLLTRVHHIRYQKCDELRDMFFINEPKGPTSVKELKERLKTGLYTVEKPKYHDDDDEEEIYWRDMFSWRTPETKKDQKGYDAAVKDFMKFVDDIVDQIKILEPKEGLALLDDVKNWKPGKSKK
jgi:hypothetical protein